jgi:excisionase family DNA binding protein
VYLDGCQDNYWYMKKNEKSGTSNIDDLIRVTEAAQLRQVSRAAIHELVQRGRLRSERMFGRVLLYRNEVLLFEKEKPGPKTEKLSG